MKKNVVLSLLGLVLLVSAVAAFNMACAEKSSNRADIARKRVTPVLNSLSGAVRRQGGKSCVFTGRKGRLRPGTVGETGQGGMLHACQALSDCRMVRKTGSQGEGGGDRQTPEGFYEVEPSGLNPRSNYHLSFNIGYPNAYDRSLNRTEASSWCMAGMFPSAAWR